MRYAALLRGINVGGNTNIAMADLAGLLKGLGYENVSTYLRSGNAVFDARKRPKPEDIESAIERELGVDVKVMIRTHDELVAAVEANPFPEAVENPKTLHVSFLSAAPKSPHVDADAIAPDEVAFVGTQMYIWTPNGIGRSKVSQHASDKKLGVAATARNWNTVLKLVEMTS
ncbi:MAG: DUF1697 domain-containing protein [Actinomycetota bacterium]